MNMFRKNKKGFTLIELIVVIAILAILAAIAIPSFIGITDRANDAVTLANARNIATAFNAYQNLNLNDPLADGVDMGAAKTAINGIGMWPAGLSADQESDAWDLLTISGGVATVPTTSEAAPAPTT